MRHEIKERVFRPPGAKQRGIAQGRRGRSGPAPKGGARGTVLQLAAVGPEATATTSTTGVWGWGLEVRG